MLSLSICLEMAQPPESYRNDHSKMVVQLAQPACVRYRLNGSLTMAIERRSICAKRHPMRAGGTRVFPGAQARHLDPEPSEEAWAADQACRGPVPPRHCPSEKRESKSCRAIRDELEDGFTVAGQPYGGAARRLDVTTLTDDATHGWNVGPNEDVMCVGIDEIRATLRWARKWTGWRYPINGSSSTSEAKRGGCPGNRLPLTPMAPEQEVYGIGGSCTRMPAAGMNWQRDFFDFGHVSGAYLN